MKKLLSVVLVLAMILGSFSMVFATDYKDVKASDANSEAISVLSGLGVIGGYADGTFRPEGTVTRAEMATMIVNALGIPVKGTAATQFSDVPASHWASGYINYAASVGFIAGYTDGTFQPEKQVSYNEAIAMIVASLGYKASMLPGTYPGSFINKATSLGILDNCKTTGTIGANRGDIAQMIYDAADCAIGYVDDQGRFVRNEGKTTNTADTMLERLGCSVLDADNDKEADVIIIDGQDAKINLHPYTGMAATVYVDGDGDIIAIAEVVGELITADCEMDGTTQKIGDYKVKTTGVYGDEPSNGFKSFLNSASSAETATSMEAAVAAHCTNEDTVTVAAKVSGNYITKIYSIATWAVDAAGVIDEDDLDDIADNKLFTIDFKKTNKDVIDTDEFAIFGAASVEDIKEDDVVYVYSNGTNIVRIEVGTEQITGVVNKINSANTKYTVGTTEYKMSGAPGAKAAPAIKDEIEAKLGYDGKIYDYDIVSADSSYAILLNQSNNASKYGVDQPVVKLFLADGTVAEYEADTDKYASIAAMSVTNGNLVSYKVNSKGVLTDIQEVAWMGAGTYEITKKGILANKEVKATTVIFTFDGVGAVSDSKSYGVAKMDAVLDCDTITNYAEFDEDGAYKAMVLVGVSTTDDIAAIVTGYATINDDDYTYEIKAMYDGKAVTFKSNTKWDDKTTTSADGNVYKLTLKADGAISGVDALGWTMMNSATAITSTTKTAVSGGILTVDETTKFGLADDMIVYVYDESEEEWTVGTAKSLAGKAADVLKIYLYDAPTADGEADLAVVFVK